MRNLGRILGLAGLLLTLVPSFLIFDGTITLDGNKTIVLIGTIFWFIGAPLALNKR